MFWQKMGNIKTLLKHLLTKFTHVNFYYHQLKISAWDIFINSDCLQPYSLIRNTTTKFYLSFYKGFNRLSCDVKCTRWGGALVKIVSFQNLTNQTTKKNLSVKFKKLTNRIEQFMLAPCWLANFHVVFMS